MCWVTEEEMETPHHKEDAARLEELLQVTIAPPGTHRLPRLPKAAGRVLTPPVCIDVVISGGALRGYFMLGARHAIESVPDAAGDVRSQSPSPEAECGGARAVRQCCVAVRASKSSASAR